MPLYLIFFSFIAMLSWKSSFANETNSLYNYQGKINDEIPDINLQNQIPKLNPREKFHAIISCTPKSGSSTLLTSFKKMGVLAHRFHVFSDEMNNYILNQKKSTKILLIDSIRDIISRKISTFFQTLPNIIELDQEKILILYNNEPDEFLQFLQNQFSKIILKIANSYTFSGWKKFNYDCLKGGSFNFKKKYQFKQIGNLYFLNLRFDDIGEWEKIIRSINLPINLKNFKIVPKNKSEDKWYAAIYKDFLANFTISKKDFDMILSNHSEEIAHFYTQQEIEALINKWKPYIVE